MRTALRQLAQLERELGKLDHVPPAHAARADALAAAHAQRPEATLLLIALDGGDVRAVRTALDALRGALQPVARARARGGRPAAP